MHDYKEEEMRKKGSITFNKESMTGLSTPVYINNTHEHSM